jgi:hypothetical protein
MRQERPRVVERAARRRPFGILVALFILSAVAIVILTNGAFGQLRPASRGDLPAIDAKTQAAVIDSITAALNETYVFADKAARMDSLLRANLASGAYRDLTDPADFMARLQEDVAKIYFDRHMGMAALPPGSVVPERAEVDPYASEEFRERMRRANYAFRKVEILPGNVGYVKFNQFVDTDLAGPTAAAAMAFVANADALIIDLRENGGGNASMIQLLAGYLFKDSVHLIDWYSRRDDKTTQSWSNDWVPGRTMYETPVYVLVSNRTGSAAEEFTFDLKNRKRATIVGETTGGAGNTVEYRVYDMGSFLAGLKLPNAQALDPETHVGWEAIGVAPDIAVPTDKALAAAHVDAIKKLEENSKDDGAKAVLAWARAGLEAELSPYAPSAKALKEYAGTFGPRKFFVEGSKLMYQREARPKQALVPMAKDLFGLEGVEYFRVRFTRDASGAVDGVVGMYDDGHEDRNPKGK